MTTLIQTNQLTKRRIHMNDHSLRRLTGVFGLILVALNWAMFPLYALPGWPPPFQDTARLIHYWTNINGIILTRVLLDILFCTCLLVFATGWRHLIRQARTEYEWVGTLAFAALLALSTVTLAGASLEGGQALDTVEGVASPTAIRALGDGYLLIYQSIGCSLIALFSAAAAYAILGTGMLPRWTGWIACVSAALNLIAVPLGLSVAPAAVLAVAIIADFPLQIWLLIVSILLIRKRKVAAPALAPRISTEPQVQSTSTS
jgi:hypothetical protein